MNFADMELTGDIKVEGITADHVWYHSKLLTDRMSTWSHDFQKLVGVMEERHKEHLKMISDLLTERAVLKSEIAALKAIAVAKE